MVDLLLDMAAAQVAAAAVVATVHLPQAAVGVEYFRAQAVQVLAAVTAVAVAPLVETLPQAINAEAEAVAGALVVATAITGSTQVVLGITKQLQGVAVVLLFPKQRHTH